MLRPRSARWFEILAARDDATLVLEALARTGAVELEARGNTGLPPSFAEVLPLLAQYAELAARYRAYWPPIEGCRPSAFPEPPVAALQRCLALVRAWAKESEPLIRALQSGESERSELLLWQPLLGTLAGRPLDPALLAGAGPWLGVRLFVLPAGCAAESVVPSGTDALQTLLCALEIDGTTHLLVTGAAPALEAATQAVAAQKGSAHPVPPWLATDPALNQAHVSRRLAALESEMAGLGATLSAVSARHGLPCALGDAYRLQWLLQNVHALETGDLLCWITGWSSETRLASLARALEACGARALLHYAAAPAGARAPLLLSNPRWARPFEIFSQAFGMPSSSEADPSALLVIVVPLMFGYMFGDVGQGLVLAAVGGWLRKRYALARLLMVGGLSAAVFGFLFGSVFSLHGIIPALWVHPFDAPLTLLLAPLAGGVLLLTLGLGLNALEAHWGGEMRRWLLGDAALIVVYLGLLAAFFVPAGLLAAAIGLVWFCVGNALLERRAMAGFGALGEAIEKTLQILVNTLSFARVGAFALAHAGLSSAVVTLMTAADNVFARAAILIVGNAVVIVLEAMVVSIQTTRLVLFEFFSRFMQGQGRAFRPLPAPPFVYQETSR
jgi:V/A-type H+-transporting ATPase subunit I